MKSFKHFRVAVAVVLFTLMTAAFLSHTADWGTGKVLHMQFVPALIAIVSGTLIVPFLLLMLITLLFGRVYCSFLCPTGILQDGITRISNFIFRLTHKKGAKRGNRGFRKQHRVLRYIILIVCGVFFALGLLWPLTLLDPYSLFGKIAGQFLASTEIFFNNCLADIFPESVPYMKYTSIATISFIWGTAALLMLILFSALKGRLYCNSICPVGTLLGLIGSKALWQVRIDSSKCLSCGACALKCKSNCINAKEKLVDYERCVVCFNCLPTCRRGAISYKFQWPFGCRNKSDENVGQKVDRNRRTTLAGLGALGTAMVANKVIGKSSSEKTGIMPPGAIDIEHFKRNCTGCYACVAACPGDIIKPATFEYGADGILLPTINYSGHFCGYECNACSNACPSGALKPLALEQKKRTAIGKAVYKAGKCIVFREGTDCGACDEHCPTKAIKMIPVPGKQYLYYPSLNSDLCIGCGGCEYICPMTPKAIKVVALASQTLAAEPTDDVQERVEVDDFGF